MALLKTFSGYISVRLIQISSPNHHTLWNALSVETLAGDLRGEFPNLVEVKINRIRSEREIDTLLKEINNNPPHVLGISVEIGSLKWTNKFLDGIKNFGTKNRPLIVLGNKLPTYFPEYFIDKYPNVIIVIGEGEESLRGIIKYIAFKIPLETIPNLAFKRTSNTIYRTLQKNPDLSLLEHSPVMDTMPDVAQNNSNALIQSSRGCSWSQCSYCTIKSFRKGRKWESFPIKRVLNNIESLVSMGVTELEFADDEFFGGANPENLERIYEIANGIENIRKTSGKDITFRIFLIPHTVYRKNRLKENEAIKKAIQRLKEVGLVKIYFGAESGCTSQLQRYQRGYTVEDLGTTIRILRDFLNIEIDVGFVMFDPDLSLDEMITNIQFFRKWNLIESNQWPFRPLIVNIGSNMYESLKNSGRIAAPDINYMSCKYKFRDENIENIFSIIDSLSLPSRDIFYALKVVSKKQFSLNKKDRETILAQNYVEENGKIYLDLMEELARFYQGNSLNSVKYILSQTKKRISSLVSQIRQDISYSLLLDSADFIKDKIKNHQRDFTLVGGR